MLDAKMQQYLDVTYRHTDIQTDIQTVRQTLNIIQVYMTVFLCSIWPNKNI